RSSAHVELHRLAGGLVFLLNRTIIDKNGDGVLRFLLVGLVQRDLHRTDLLRGLALGDLEFVVVAVAAGLQLFHVVAIVRDQAAHHAHVTGGTVQLALGGFQVGASSLDIFLRAADFGGNGVNFFVVLLRAGVELLGELLVGNQLILADSFGAALRIG